MYPLVFRLELVFRFERARLKPRRTIVLENAPLGAEVGGTIPKTALLPGTAFKEWFAKGTASALPL